MSKNKISDFRHHVQWCIRAEVAPTFLTYFLFLIQIKWSDGDAVVHVEFNGTPPYSVNDQVADFMHIVDKNGSRQIGGLKKFKKIHK